LVSYCEAATDFNVAQAYADAAETHGGSQPDALTSVPGLPQRIVNAEAVGVWFELTGVFNVAGNFKVEQLTLRI
jgi:hypothetical protein